MAADVVRGRGAGVAQPKARRAARDLRAAPLAALLAGFALAAHAAAPERSATDDIRGVWVDHRDGDKHKVAVSIEDCDGLLCGRIYWLKKPTVRRRAQARPAQPRRRAPRPSAVRPPDHDRLSAGRRSGTGTAGHIYNPNDGRTFNSTIELEGDGSLRIRGFIGVSLFGKTVEWVRPPEPLERCR